MTHKVQIGFILFGVFWSRMAIFFSVPFLTIFLSSHTSISLIHIGVIVGIAPFTMCVMSFLGGYLSDRLTHIKILKCSLALSLFAYIGFYLASGFYNSTLTQTLMFSFQSFLVGIGNALFSPSSKSLLSALVDNQQEATKLMHLRYYLINIAAAIGPILGVYFGVSGSRLAFLATAAIYGFLSTLSLFCLRQSKLNLFNFSRSLSHKISMINALKITLKNHKFFRLVLSTLIFYMIYIQIDSNFAVMVAKQFNNGTLIFALLLSLNAILILLLQPAIYRLIRYIPQIKVYASGYVVIIGGSILMLFLNFNTVSLIWFVVALTISEILILPTSSALVIEFNANQSRGVAFGVMDLSQLGNAVGPMIGAAAVQHGSIKIFFFLIVILSIFGFCVFIPCLSPVRK